MAENGTRELEREGQSAEFLARLRRAARDGAGVHINDEFVEMAREASRMVGSSSAEIERGLNAHPGDWALKVADEYHARNRRLSLAIIDAMDGTGVEKERALEALKDIAANDAIPSHRHAARAELCGVPLESRHCRRRKSGRLSGRS